MLLMLFWNSRVCTTELKKLGGEYGNADFDVRHTINGYLVYEVPKFTGYAPLLTKSWQTNAFITVFTRTPIAVKLGTSTDRSQTREFQIGRIKSVI